MSDIVETQAAPALPASDASSVLAAKGTAAVAEVPASDEPQNALTKEFTDAEWEALKTFRVCINIERCARGSGIDIHHSNIDQAS